MGRRYKLDIDTKRYVNRINSLRKSFNIDELLTENIQDIDNFIISIKDLGIWNTSTFWIFRSKYNVGIGNSIPNLGGFLSQDASLLGVGSSYPSWSDDGISITATNQGITTNINQGQSLGLVGYYSSILKLANTANEGYRIITCDIPTRGNGFGVDDFDATNLRFINMGGGFIPKSLLTNFQFLSFGKGIFPNGVKTYLGNTVYSSSSSNAPVVRPTSNINIGGRDLVDINGNPRSIQSKSQTNAFFMVSPVMLSVPQHQTIYNNLKNTIGKGLGLS